MRSTFTEGNGGNEGQFRQFDHEMEKKFNREEREAARISD
jgi:hypothetical protein